MTPSTRSDCSKLHATWPWTLSGFQHLCWATSPYVSPPSVEKNQKTTLSLYPVKSILFHFKTVSPCPVTTVPGQSVFLISPLFILKDLIASSTGGTAPALSAFFPSTGILMLFSWPSSEPTLTGPCRSCAGMPDSRWGLTRAKWREKFTSPVKAQGCRLVQTHKASPALGVAHQCPHWRHYPSPPPEEPFLCAFKQGGSQ